MLKKRIIPCLDIKNGRTVKGVNFIDIQDAGDPVELAKGYVRQGADELVFLDITATIENRSTLIDLVQKIGKEINIPFTVGGGINSLEDASKLITAGADKVSVNSSAVKNPQLIKDIASKFGSQCIVVAVDTKLIGEEWIVFTKGGRTQTELRTLDWIKQAEELGAGEILLTSMNHDGTKSGFALDITQQAGAKEHFYELFQKGISAGLAASIFHYGEIPIPKLKEYLIKQNISIRK